VSDLAAMTRQISLAVLWFFAAWTTASMGAFAASLPGWIAPIIALAAAAAALRPVVGVRRAPAPTLTDGAIPSR